VALIDRRQAWHDVARLERASIQSRTVDATRRVAERDRADIVGKPMAVTAPIVTGIVHQWIAGRPLSTSIGR
jgi:hypothetical protein